MANMNHAETCGICHTVGCAHQLMTELSRRMGVEPDAEAATLRAQLAIATAALEKIDFAKPEECTFSWARQQAHEALRAIKGEGGGETT